MADVPSKMIMMDQWDDQIFQVVGEITIAFAQLDHILLLVWKRIEGKSVQDFSKRDWKEIKKNRFIPNRCKQIRKAAARNGRISVPALEWVLAQVEDIANQRNAVAHGQWGYEKDKETGAISQRHRVWEGNDRGVNLFQLRAARDLIRRLREELQALVPPSRPSRAVKQFQQ